MVKPRTTLRPVWALLLCVACFLSNTTTAHPGSGIVIDSHGNIYIVDMVSGVWKADRKGTLTHLPGPGFHWMALDEGGRFGSTTLPSGSRGVIERLPGNPELLLASDYPIAIGNDGTLYHPSWEGSGPLRILKLDAGGQSSTAFSLPSDSGHPPIRFLNGLAAGPDGDFYYTEDRAVRRIDRRGTVSTVAENISIQDCESLRASEGDSGPLLRGLAVDSAGTVYAAATGCGALLKISPGGKVSTVVRAEAPWSPTGVAISGSMVYVLEFTGADSEIRREMVPRIREISPSGGSRIIATVSRK